MVCHRHVLLILMVLFGGTPEEATFYTWWSKHRLLEQKAPECRQIFWLDSRWDGQADRLIKLVGLSIAFLSWDWRKKSGLFVWDVRICSREKRPKGPTCNTFFFVCCCWTYRLTVSIFCILVELSRCCRNFTRKTSYTWGGPQNEELK